MASQIPFDWTATAPALTQVVGPPVLVYSNDYPDANSYAVYAYFVAVLVLIFIALLVKIALNRKRYQARSAAVLRQTRARQNQLSTVSRSVDANIANSNDSRRGSDETLKIDLPPTYEEVMRKEATAPATPSTVSIAAQTIDTHEIVQIETETISTHHRRDLH